MYVPFKEVTLDEEDLAAIEKEIESRGEMPAHNKSVLRDILKRDYKFWKHEQQDYVYGEDTGSQAGERN